jgi:hypothetical protein
MECCNRGNHGMAIHCIYVMDFFSLMVPLERVTGFKQYGFVNLIYLWDEIVHAVVA